MFYIRFCAVHAPLALGRNLPAVAVSGLGPLLAWFTAAWVQLQSELGNSPLALGCSGIPPVVLVIPYGGPCARKRTTRRARAVGPLPTRRGALGWAQIPPARCCCCRSVVFA